MVKENGRPTICNEEFIIEICDRLAEGESLVSICRSEHMPDRVTIYNWLLAATKDDKGKEIYKEFLNRYTRARELQADSYFDEAIDIADDSSNDTETKVKGGLEYDVTNNEAIQRSKLRVETRFRVAAITKPTKYSEKKRLELTGEAGGAIKTEVGLSPELKGLLDAVYK